MRIPVLITALILLFVANIFMMYYIPFGLRFLGEGFQNTPAVNMTTAPITTSTGGVLPPFPVVPMTVPNDVPMPSMPPMTATPPTTPTAPMPPMPPMTPMTPTAPMTPEPKVAGFKNKEGFTSYSLANGGGAKDTYESIGPYDGVRLPTGNSSGWRYTSPNEPLTGPAFEPGPNDLFMFKNNQCKPECCGASFSCDGGCVCTTPKQRDYLNSRGGNRTSPDDGV
jgi:hypothetical protein